MSQSLRAQFPLLANAGSPRLAYLDSASSTQKAEVVLRAMDEFSRTKYANVHRGAYRLSVEASDAYESARAATAKFLNAASSREIVFTAGTTAAINLVATSLAHNYLRWGDEVLVTEQEHHANIVPWQLWGERIGFRVRFLPVLPSGDWDMARLPDLLGPKTKLVAAVHVSNALGAVNPVDELVRQAKAKGIPVLLDGAQAAPHMPVDVRALDCDFYVFSAHKLYGPNGIGVLYGKSDWLRRMPPAQGGGGMIETVTFEKTTFAEPPARFEPGTPPIVEAVGLEASIRFVENVGRQRIADEEKALASYLVEKIQSVPNVTIIGTPKERVGIVSFVLADVHAHDLATVLDANRVCVRAGHHCTQPLMQRFRVPATVRASLGIYSEKADVDQLVAGLEKARELFRL